MLNYVWVVGALMIGTLLISMTISSITSSSSSFIDKSPLMWINPVMMFANALEYRNSNPDISMQLTWGVVTYLALSFFMIWRLTNNFKFYAYENG